MNDKELKRRLASLMLDVEDIAAERIQDAFPELFDPEFEIGDEPVHPLVYIDNNNILFRDKYDRFFFWNETYTEINGPYSDSPTACTAMRRYASELDGYKIIDSLIAEDPEGDFYV